MSVRPHLWLVRFLGIVVPARLRADWRSEWEAELSYREQQLADWDRLDWRTKLGLLGQTTSAFWDALALQPRRWEDEMVQDVRYASRLLWRAKAFAAAAICSVAIGLGANAAVFAVVRAVVLQPLPFPDPDRLVTVGTSVTHLFSAPGYHALQQQNQVLDSIGAFETTDFLLTGDGPATQLGGQRISPELVPLLGLNGMLRPVAGRMIAREEFQDDGPSVALISDRLWRQRFNHDPAIVGRSIRLDGESHTVVGVISPRFTLFPDADLLLPLRFTPAQAADELFRRLELIGRLRPTVTLADSQRQLSDALDRVQRQQPSVQARLTPLRDRVVAHFDRTLFTLWGVTGLVFVISCLNFSNLLLARSVSRRREVALRAALGARPIRLVRLVITEAVLLSLAGGAFGIALAYGGMRALVVLGPKVIPRLAEIDFNPSVIGLAALLALAAGLVFGGVPALTLANPNLNRVLNDPDGAGIRGFALFKHHRGKAVLTLTQIAATLVLLVGAALLAKSFWQLARLTPGYEPSHLMAMQFELPADRYGTAANLIQFVNDVTAKVKALPGVTRVGSTSSLPLLPSRWSFRSVFIEGRTDQIPAVAGDMPLGMDPPPPPPPPKPGSSGPPPHLQPRLLVFQSQVGPEFLDAMAIPLLSGRGFTAGDNERAPAVAIINYTMAQRLWPGGSALGHRVRAGPFDPWATIIGVVGDIRRFSRDDNARPELFVPLAQKAADLRPDRPLSPQMKPSVRLSFAVRLAATHELPADTLRREVAAVDPDLAVTRLSTMASILDEAVASRGFVLTAFAIFASLALVLAAIGTYGLMSYVVRQRTREFGVRIALGAGRAHVLWVAIADGLKVGVAGVAVGLAIAFAASAAVGAWLYNVAPTDPPTYVLLAMAMMAVVALASYLPARRAARIDPIQTLRQD